VFKCLRIYLCEFYGIVGNFYSNISEIIAFYSNMVIAGRDCKSSFFKREMFYTYSSILKTSNNNGTAHSSIN